MTNLENGKIKVKQVQMTSTDQKKIVGMHVFGNLYDIDPKIAQDMEYLKAVVLKAIEIAKMTLVEQKAWKFGGDKGGVSVIALITESHVALHTWNEYKYASIDIFTCGEHSDPQAAYKYVIEALKPKKHQVFQANRSSQ